MDLLSGGFLGSGSETNVTTETTQSLQQELYVTRLFLLKLDAQMELVLDELQRQGIHVPRSE